MRIYNFLSKKVEEFKPIGEIVGLYTCGPTVYDFVHIGNWRTFVFEDVLKRALVFGGYKVKHVMNITDIEDKIIKRSKEEKVSIEQFTSKYTEAFFKDLKELNILPADVYPGATDKKYISSMIQIIELLLKKGYAYRAKDGVYFAVEKFKDYGKLSGLEKRQLKKGARINDDEYDKENWSDFVLWKYPKEGEPSWLAPFGAGRPGWHIECSAMSIAELGEQIDIHTGGVDLLFPHHENEIAQSEAATGKKFVNFWMEGEHLLVDGQKMAKRLGNIFTLKDVVAKGIEPLALRYLYLTAHYRSKLNFTWESLKAAHNALNNLRTEISGWDEPKVGCAEFEGRFKEAINDDLNMPGALAVMWEMVKSDYPTSAKHQSITVMDRVLGLGLVDIKKQELPEGAQELINRREQIRAEGKFEESDKLRQELLEMGVEVEDTPEGPKWKVKDKVTGSDPAR